ncbi:MAG TPA: hypothetical protein VMH27_19205 [Puia sp.]|nr:hypothetical protein [Puia sp.]
MILLFMMDVLPGSKLYSAAGDSELIRGGMVAAFGRNPAAGDRWEGPRLIVCCFRALPSGSWQELQFIGGNPIDFRKGRARVVQLNFLFGGRFGILVHKLMAMNTLIIDKKKYVVLPEKEYENLRTKAVSKSASARKLSLSEGKKLAYKLIDKWVKEK